MDFLEIIGIAPRFFRPPYGNVNEEIAEKLWKICGLKTVNWNLNSYDWLHTKEGHDPRKIFDIVNKKLDSKISSSKKNSFISLHHDSLGLEFKKDIARLDKIVNLVQSKGYKFVTIDECLNEKPYFDEEGILS